MNLLHCWEKKLFEDSERVSQLLKDWWAQCITQDKTRSPQEAFSILAQTIKRNTVLWGKSVNIDEILLARIVTFAAFYASSASPDAESHSFFRVKYVTDLYGIGLKMALAFDQDIFEKVDAINGDPDALRPGAHVRGTMPISWVANKEIFSEDRTKFGERYSDDLAFSLCQKLGLEAKPYIDLALFQLNCPASADVRVHRMDARRATAMEGFEHLFYRARRDGVYSDARGRSVDLQRFGSGEDDIDGAEELVMPSMPLTDAFSWQGIGFLRRDTTPPNEGEFCARLCSIDIDKRLADAARLIDGLCQ